MKGSFPLLPRLPPLILFLIFMRVSSLRKPYFKMANNPLLMGFSAIYFAIILFPLLIQLGLVRVFAMNLSFKAASGLFCDSC
jgi:protein-S-isoprenylcysteine O-methyltransferase Ste14